MLEIRNLSKKFGEKKVLDDISLKIEKGKVVVIIGPSGTGKSTLLRCINVLERPEKGTIRLENKTIDDLCGLPCFKYGRVIYETETVRKTWNVKEPVFPYTIGSRGNLAIPLDLSRREIFENGKMVL